VVSAIVFVCSCVASHCCSRSTVNGYHTNSDTSGNTSDCFKQALKMFRFQWVVYCYRWQHLWGTVLMGELRGEW